jgi:hypothetical protein
MKSLFSVILFIHSICVFSQNAISGIVLDSLSQKPLPYVTVYINGTTRGTITDEKGFFILSNITIPSVLVLSHVSYNPKIIYISNVPEKLLIELRAKVYSLSEIKVTDKNLRKKNIDIFKRMFLGTDHWGENTVLNNDSVLVFNLDYEYKTLWLNESIKNEIKLGLIKNIYKWGKDSLCVVVRELKSFKASATAPLLIDMPLLGYKLRVDLINFSIQYAYPKTLGNFLGYYYFQPYNIESKYKAKKIEKNRQSVYYNSTQHFYRSLFEKKLGQNGYSLGEAIKDTTINRIKFTNYINIDSFTKYSENNIMQVIGLKNTVFNVLYYYKSNRTPLDLTTNKISYNSFYKSEIYFFSDTCTITKEGTVPNNNIGFGGEISKKKVGTFLPDDYYIVNKNEVLKKAK